MHRAALILVLLISAGNTAVAADNLMRMEWKVDGVSREALVYVPAAAKTTPCPVVFAFHGHGGTMNYAAAKFAYQKHWPEAIAVYMQGLNTPGALTDREGKKPGWQKTFGDQQDRDLKFFDAVLATLKRDYRVDEKRVYATGHSNGGAFTYLLWAARGDAFAAVAPCAAAAKTEFKRHLKPKPVLHMAGENDPLVRFAWQQRTIDELRKLNGCGDGTPWGEHCTLYPSKVGTPVVTYIHHGGHAMPAEVPPVIVRFFKEHAKP
jgi:polyhydroxybutyrate depolymerase